MYWGKRRSFPNYIVRANLDGSNAKIISSEFADIGGITLDAKNEVLYWAGYTTNTVGTIDVNGGNKTTLAELEGDPRPSGIQIDAKKIYIGN